MQGIENKHIFSYANDTTLPMANEENLITIIEVLEFFLT
jgi:hypothetical protein